MKPEGGRFDEDTYASARKWREEQEAKKSEVPKAEVKTPSKRRVAPAASKVEDKPMPAAARGSGRGGQGGPTADELDAYDKQQKDKRFEDSIRANLSTSENDEANKYRDRAIGAATAAASLVPGAMLARGAKKGVDTLGAMRDMTAGGPRVASRVTPSRPASRVGRKTGVSDDARKAGEGFSPAEANRMLARNEAKKTAAAKAPAKPPAAPKPKAKRPTAARTKKFNDDEAGVEFAKGGMIKRGWGKARC
jgi:hypothetical protein